MSKSKTATVVKITGARRQGKIFVGENGRERQFEREKLCEGDVGTDFGRSTGNRFPRKPTIKDLPARQDTTHARKNYATSDSCWWSRLRFFSGWILNSNGAVQVLKKWAYA